MIKKSKDLILILLVLAIFTGVAIELSEGSFAVGFFLFLILVFLLTNIDLNQIENLRLLKKSKIYFFAGVFILFADIFYNFYLGGRELRTLDIMVIFLGFSLIGTQKRSVKVARFSSFGMYLSFVFILLYLIFYTLFPFLNIDFVHKFNYYFILLPTVIFLGIVGIHIGIVGTEIALVSGIEEIPLDIGGPFSGLYSMFLLIGIVFAYSRIENMDTKRTLKMLLFCIVITYISNLFRIMAIYWIAYTLGGEVMMTVYMNVGCFIAAVFSILFVLLLPFKNSV